MIAPFLQELEQVFGWLLAASWQASVLALFVLLIQRVLGSRLNPRWRYALWLLVVLRLILPAVPESALSLFQFAPPAPAALTVSVSKPLFVSAPVVSLPEVSVEITEPSHPLSIYSLLAVAWLAGVLVLLVLTWQVNRRFARQVADSPAVADPELRNLFAESKTELGIRRSIRLIESAQVQSPAIMGLFQPTLLLPTDVREKFDATELRFIFLHELAHLKRGDVAVQALIALLQILHWFNPVLWFAFRRMRIDREPATDALVLSRTGEQEKERYGLMLIKLLEHFNQRHSLPTLVGILEDKDQFKRRFSLIARFTRGAYGWSLLGVIVIAILGIACLTKSKTAASSPQFWPPADLNKSIGFTALQATGEVHPSADPAVESTLDNLKLNTLDIPTLPLHLYLDELAKVLKEQNPGSDQVTFVLMCPAEDQPHQVSFHLQHPSTLREILAQLNAQYPLRYQIRGPTDIIVWQVSHFETDFKKLAAQTTIDLNIDGATPAEALKTVQTAAAAKGFVFDISNFANPDRFPPDAPHDITLQQNQITLERALVTILAASKTRLIYEFDGTSKKYSVMPNLQDSFPLEPMADTAMAATQQPDDPALPYELDLKPVYTKVFQPDGSNSSYRGYAGRKIIDGLPFDVGGDSTLFGKSNAERNKDYPESITIPVGRKFDELHLIHAAQWRDYYGCPVAVLRLHYADGSSYDFPIRFDFQVNDWSRLYTEDEEIVADPDTKIIWRGPGGAEGLGRLFKSMLRNPFPGRKVDSLEAIAAGHNASYTLVAATIAQSDPQREVTAGMPPVPARHFDGTLNVIVLDRVTGAPIAGAEVYPAMIIGDISLVADTVLTGANGVAPVKYPKDGAKDLRVEVMKDGYLTCDDNWNNGWQAGSIPPDVTYLLTPGRDPALDARRVTGHWKLAIKPQVTADNRTVDVSLFPDAAAFNQFNLYLSPKMAPPPFPPDADTPDKRQKWFQDWLRTDAGKQFIAKQRMGRLLQLKADRTFSGESVAPGEYHLSARISGDGRQVQVNPRDVVIPPNPGTDPNAPVDLGEIELQVPASQTDATSPANPVAAPIPAAADAGATQNAGDNVRVQLLAVDMAESDYQANRAKIDDAIHNGLYWTLEHSATGQEVGDASLSTQFGKGTGYINGPNDPCLLIECTPTLTQGKITVAGKLVINSKHWSNDAKGRALKLQPIPGATFPFTGSLTPNQVQAVLPEGIEEPPDALPPSAKGPRRLFLFVSVWPLEAADKGAGITPPDASTPAVGNSSTRGINESGNHGSPLNSPVDLVLTLVEINEKTYDQNAQAMDEAVRTGNIHFFADRKDVFVTPDFKMTLATNKGWYSVGEAQSFVGSVTYDKVNGAPLTTINASAVFIGINADFIVSPSLQDGISIDSTWSDIEPDSISNQKFDPKAFPAKVPATLDLSPKMNAAKFTDKGWRIEAGITHGFWIGKTLGQFARTSQFKDRSLASLEEMIKSKIPSRLAVFMTARPEKPNADAPATDLNIRKPKPVTEGDPLKQDLNFDKSGFPATATGGSGIVYGDGIYHSSTRVKAARNPALDQTLISLARDGRTDKVGKGDAARIAQLIADGADPNAKDNYASALVWALNFGKDDAAQVLLQNGADTSVVVAGGQKPAWLAASIYLCPGALELMIKKGADVKSPDKQGDTIFSEMLLAPQPAAGKMNYLRDRVWTDADFQAWQERERRTVDLLVGAGVDINGRSGPEAKTPLMLAIQHGHTEMTRELIARGADVSLKDTNGETAATLAQMYGHPEILPLLNAPPASPAPSNPPTPAK